MNVSKVFLNAKKVTSQPKMLKAYGRWQLERLMFKSYPAVACTPNTKIREWINFSEYWSFLDGIPDREMQLIKRCLCPESSSHSIAIDIGANLGLFSIALASLGYRQVHSFEPISKTFSRLYKNVCQNALQDKVILNSLAVGASEGTVSFEIFDKSPAINRLAVNNKSLQKRTSREQIHVTTLDRYCLERNIEKIDFLKIDVEGMEPLVLQGAKSLLEDKRISAILLEICPANLEIVSQSLDFLYQLMIQYGYFPHRLLANGEAGEALDLEDLKSITLENVVVIPGF